MSKAAKRARNAAVIELLCERFPQTLNRGGPQPLKVGVYADVLTALGDAVQPRDLQSALRAYTSNARYLRAISVGAPRIGLDGKPVGTVTSEDEAVAKKRLVDLVKETAPQGKVPAAQAVPKASPDRSRRGKPETARAQKAIAGRLARGRPATPGGYSVARRF